MPLPELHQQAFTPAHAQWSCNCEGVWQCVVCGLMRMSVLRATHTSRPPPVRSGRAACGLRPSPAQGAGGGRGAGAEGGAAGCGAGRRDRRAGAAQGCGSHDAQGLGFRDPGRPPAVAAGMALGILSTGAAAVGAWVLAFFTISQEIRLPGIKSFFPIERSQVTS